LSKCIGTRADGQPCAAQAIVDSSWCFNHHPDYEEVRRRRASRGGKRGGRGRPSPATAELARLQQRFEELSEDLVEEPYNADTYPVMGRLLNYARQCIVKSLQDRQVEELAQRIEVLEESLQSRRERTWGA
jgi:predicted RNase H-like nuclease (RuvC/YqgF family)